MLLRTSLLDRVNGALADLLTGATGSERILLELEDANAFVVSLDPDRAPGSATTACSADCSGWNFAASCPKTSPNCTGSPRAGLLSMARPPMLLGTCKQLATGPTRPACSPTTPSASPSTGRREPWLRCCTPSRAGTARSSPSWPWCTPSPTWTSYVSTRPMRACRWPGHTPPRRHPAAGTGCNWPSRPWTCC